MSKVTIDLKYFLATYPFYAGLSVFYLVFICVNIFGFGLGVWAMSQPCESPCDGGPMAAGFIRMFSIIISMVFGVVFGGITWLKLKSRGN
jgi:hypothetical protein